MVVSALGLPIPSVEAIVRVHAVRARVLFLWDTTRDFTRKNPGSLDLTFDDLHHGQCANQAL